MQLVSKSVNDLDYRVELIKLLCAVRESVGLKSSVPCSFVPLSCSFGSRLS